MAKYVVCYRYTRRSMRGIRTVEGYSEIVTTSIKKAKLKVDAVAVKNGLEDFKITSGKKVSCFECFDTGISRYDGCMCGCIICLAD